MQNTVWKNQKFTIALKIFREITFYMIIKKEDGFTEFLVKQWWE